MPPFTPINMNDMSMEDVATGNSHDSGLGYYDDGENFRDVKLEETSEADTIVADTTNIKQEDVNLTGIGLNQSTSVSAPKTTPKKRGRKPGSTTAKKNTLPSKMAPKKAQIDNNIDNDEEEESPSKKTKTLGAATPVKTTITTTTTTKKRGGGGGQTQSQTQLPAAYESASKEDRMVIYLRDIQGKGWNEIDSAWEAMTGHKPAPTTLRKRYTRVKANLTVFKEEDVAKLISCKTEIEDRFESEKWNKIADAIVAKGGDQYPAAACLKKWKELVGKKTATTTSPRKAGTGIAGSNGNGNGKAAAHHHDGKVEGDADADADVAGYADDEA